MQFFIALGLLTALSTAYLLHQFWSRSLECDEPASLPTERTTPSDSDQLKAA